MPTFNHEKYVAEAIESVLAQTFESFELVIVNDGSSDRTDDVIRGFQDKRIVYLQQPNQGLSIALNNGVLASRGEYIAIFSGDDVCRPDRLERQSRYVAETGAQAVTCWADIIDESSVMVNDHPLESVFNQPQLSRPATFRKFFVDGNFLLAVGALVQRQLLLDAGSFRATSLQLQDFAMWIEVIKRVEIHVLPERLLMYRVRDHDMNLSSRANDARTLFESHELRRVMLDDLPIELFREAFAQDVRNASFTDGVEFALEKAFLYTGNPDVWTQSIGAGQLFEMLTDSAVLEVASTKYGFDLPALFELTAKLDVTRRAERNRLADELQRAHAEGASIRAAAATAENDLELSRELVRSINAELANERELHHKAEFELANERDLHRRTEAALAQCIEDHTGSRRQLSEASEELQRVKDDRTVLESSRMMRLVRRYWRLRDRLRRPFRRS